MNELNQTMARICGLDTVNEVINLWFEVTYLRILISEILINNEQVINSISPEIFEKCRERSKEFLLDKFPMMGIKFNDKENESKKSEEKND